MAHQGSLDGTFCVVRQIYQESSASSPSPITLQLDQLLSCLSCLRNIQTITSRIAIEFTTKAARLIPAAPGALNPNLTALLFPTTHGSRSALYALDAKKSARSILPQPNVVLTIRPCCLSRQCQSPQATKRLLLLQSMRSTIYHARQP